MIRQVPSYRALQIWFVRVHHRLGWASVAGLALIAAAAAVLATAWGERRSTAATAARIASIRAEASRTLASVRISETISPTANALPPMSDLPTLLTRVESIAVDNRLGWVAADYRIRPATDHDPACMEIRTQFVGTYPQIRRMVTQAVDHVPALTFRQLSFTRTSSNSADVETKVVFAILLADGPATATSSASAPTRGDITASEPR